MLGRKLKALMLAGLLAVPFCTPALAADEIIRSRQVLALLPVLRENRPDVACSEAMYQTLMRQPAYDLLPDWYVLQRLEQNPARWENDWGGLFGRIKEADLAMLNRIEIHPPGEGQNGGLQLVGILIQQGNPAKILRAEVLPFAAGELTVSCEKMVHHLLGQPEPETFRNPALSATLSLLIPGAGHLYRGTFDGVLMGVGFLAAYLGMTFLGFSDSTAPTVTRSQWGGLLILLTLVDVVTAYFLADQ